MAIAIITGASSGIGKEMLMQISGFEGIDEIWAIARSSGRLEKLKNQSRIPVRPVPMDLCNAENFKTLSDMLEKEGAKVSVLINCAGYGKFGSYSDIDIDASLGMIDLNCRALVGVTESIIPFMPKGSSILQVCSIAAFQPLPLANIYAATKAFVLNYSRALAVELSDKKISVTALCPGWTDTPFFDRATDTKNPGAVTNYSFMQTPERVAKQGLTAMRKGRCVSIVGKQNKILYVLNKILPVKLVMKIWLRLKN